MEIKIDGKSDTSFLDNAKDFAVNTYNQTSNEFSRLSHNRTERQAILDRELKDGSLTSRQIEQLKKISNADDAQRFVEAAQLGGANGGQKEYDEIMKTQRDALISFGTDVGEMALGGAALKGGVRLGKAVFKGSAEAIGSKLPSLKKVSNVFKTEADLAEEAKAAQKAARAAEREKRAQESVQKAQEEAKQKRDTRNNNSNPFKNETRQAQEKAKEQAENKAKEKAKEEIIDETPDKSGLRKAAEWVGGKAADAGKWVGGQILGQAKDLGGSLAKGMVAGGTVGLAGVGIYDELSDEHKKAVSDTLQEVVDNPEKYIDKGKDLFDEGKKLYDEITEDPEAALDKAKEKGSEIASSAGDLASKAASLLAGAYVGSNGNPFKGTASGIVGGIGGLFSSNRSSEAALSSMPSGGDSGIVGESHFGSEDMSGKSANEILSKIYSVLTKIHDTTLGIARDTSALVRSSTGQDAARDAASANLLARQNEGGSASPVFSGGGGGSDDNETASPKKKDKEDKDKKDKGGFWDSISKKLPKAAKIALGALGGRGKAAAKLLGRGLGTTASVVKNVVPKAAKVAGTIGAAGLILDNNIEKELDEQGITDPYTREAIKGKMLSESGGRGGGEGNWTKTSNARIREKMPQLKHMSDEELDNLKAQGNEAFLDKAYEKYGGYKYRGRGLTQLTGKANYEAADKALGLNGELANNPDILATDKDLDKKVSVWFYKNAGANKKKFGSQEEANEWAIAAAGGKKYAPGTSLGQAELARVTDIQQKRASLAAKETAPQNIAVTSELAQPKQVADINVSTKTGGGNIPAVLTTDELFKPTATAVPKSFADDTAKVESEQLAMLKENIEKERTEKLNAIGARRGKGEDDKTLDAEGEKVLNEYHEQLKDLSSRTNKLTQSTATATPVSNSKMDDMQAEVGDIDEQRDALKAEKEKIGLNVNVSPKQMEMDLDRLSDIHTEMNSLDERRNNITGSKDYLSGLEQQKSGGMQQASMQQIPQQQVPQPMAPPSPAGTGKIMPMVRNDDPTIKMMEEGNMWRTTTHEA